jgi:ParB family transcriptional regulator, chromosome partitioning protein
MSKISKATKLKAQLGGNMAASIAGAAPNVAANIPPARAEDAKYVGRRPDQQGARIRVDLIDPDPDQPRKTFGTEELHNLAASLKAHGQLQPIVVRWVPATGRYAVIAGERRWRAAQLGGLTELRAVVLDESGSMDRVTIRELQILENALREDVKPVEQAAAYQELMEAKGWSMSQLAQRLCVDKGTISRALSLLGLGEPLRAAVESGAIPPSTAAEASKIRDPAKRQEVEAKIVADRPSRAEAAALAREASDKPLKPVRGNSTPPPPRPAPPRPSGQTRTTQSTTLDVTARRTDVGNESWSVRTLGGEELTAEGLQALIAWAKDQLAQRRTKRGAA